MTQVEDIGRYGVIGCSFREAPARVRGRLAFTDEWCEKTRDQLLGGGFVDGIAFLSTCNRNEVIFSSKQPGWAVEVLRTQLFDLAPPGGELPHWAPYRHVGRDAARHVLRVAAALDSLAVGEREIGAQLRRSFERARRGGHLDKHLNGLSRASQETAREIHEQTHLGDLGAGMFGFAREAIARETAHLERPRVGVVGLGEIGLRTARRLAADHRYDLVLASRRLRDAHELGTTLATCAVHEWNSLHTLWDTLDAAVVATGAPGPVVTRATLEGHTKPLVLVDLGIPPQIESEVAELAHVKVYDLDWFADHERSQPTAASVAMGQAAQLVEQGLDRLDEWLQLRRHARVLDTCQTVTARFKTQVLPDLVQKRFATLDHAQRRELYDELHALLTAYSNDLYATLGRELAHASGDDRDER